MKIEITPNADYSGVDPSSAQEDMEALFSEILKIAKTWADQSWIPECLRGEIPRVHVIEGVPDRRALPTEFSDGWGFLYISDDLVVYRTESDKGEYIYSPKKFAFSGFRGSFAAGSAIGGWDVIYGDNRSILRVDLTFACPLCSVTHAELGAYKFKIGVETSTPDVKLGSTR